MIKKYRFAITLFLSIVLLLTSLVCNKLYYGATQNLIALKEDYNKAYAKLEETYTALNIEVEKVEGLSNSLADARQELDNAQQTISDLKTTEYEMVYMGDFKLTHYCTDNYEHICGNGDGITATGTQIVAGKTIAIDPDVIPYGTKVYIEGYGWREAQDCGGAVNGKHIDIAVSTHDQAMSMGINYGGVWILAEKS